MALCTVSGVGYLPSGEVARSRAFVFSRAGRGISSGGDGVILGDSVTARTSRFGMIDVELFTGTYMMESSGYVASINVPDEISATLDQVLESTT